MTYAFMVFGLLALYLNRDSKWGLPAIYLGGLVLEELVDFWYVQYIDTRWIYYYFLIAAIDIVILSIMVPAFHKQYVLVYPIVFLMFLVNAMIVREKDTTGSQFAYDIRLDILHPLNVLILLLFFGADNGFKRILNDIRHPGDTFRRAYHAGRIWARDSLSSLQTVESHKGEGHCKPQQQR